MSISIFAKTAVCSLAGLGVMSVASGADSWTLVERGHPAAVIVLPAAGPAGGAGEDGNLAAARMLAAHLREMSGADLAIRRENELRAVTIEAGRLVSDDLPGTCLLVGEGELAGKLGVSGKELGAGGIRVRTVGNAVVLIGKATPVDPGAATYAAVALLEELGCRYLWPGELGKIVPRRDTLTVGPLDIRFTPPIQQREIRWWLVRDDLSVLVASGLKSLQLDPDAWQRRAQAAVATPSVCDWRSWHGLGGNLGLKGTHSGAGTRYSAGWRAALDAHPEWFALQADGTRSFCDRYRLCKSNPELIDYVAKGIVAYLSTNPGVISVSLSPNDGTYASFCMCEACKRLDPPDAPKVDFVVFAKQGESARSTIQYPSLTDRMLWYWNRVAEQVVQVHPDVRFVIDAYSIFKTPPVRERPHPNLVVRYVSSDKEGWMQWRERGLQGIYWRPNLFWKGATSGRIQLYTQDMADFFPFAAANGALATDVDSILDHWALQGLNYYVAARLNWDPARPVNAIVDDYCRAGFGAGAEAVGRYFRLAEAVGCERLATDDELAALRGHLDVAARATTTDPLIQARLAFLRTGFNFHHLHTVLNRMAEAAKAKAPWDRELAGRLLNLNYVMMRDLARQHVLAVNTPFLMYRSSSLAHLGPMGGRGFQAAPEVLKRAEVRSLTGRENSLEELLAAYGLDSVTAAPAGRTERTRVRADADEEGRAVEVQAQ